MERLPAGTPTAGSRQYQILVQPIPHTFRPPDVSETSSPFRAQLTEDCIIPPTEQQAPDEDMSYRSYKDYKLEDGLADHGSMSLAGIIALQSDRKKGHRFWRSMQASDVGDPEHVSGDCSSISSHIDSTGQSSIEPEAANLFSGLRQNSARSWYASSTQKPLGSLHEEVRAFQKPESSTQVDSKDDFRNEERYLAEVTREQLFGLLPDPIRLSEQTGEFDGQVIFIGHPNRDISAHQWSLPAFQWMNIGRYSYFRRKLEGSLASDRLRGMTEIRDTLEHFKLAAENRQALVVENGRSEQHTTITQQDFGLRSNIGSLNQSLLEAPAQKFYNTAQIQTARGLPLPWVIPSSFTKTSLEDPFVTTANNLNWQSPSSKRDPDDWIHSTGSLDLTYQFPSQLAAATSTTDEAHYGHRKSGVFMNDVAESAAPILSSESPLQEVAFGEEAATHQRLGPADDSIPKQWLLPHVQRTHHIEGSGTASPRYKNTSSSITRMTSAPLTQNAASARTAVPLIYTKSALNASAVPFARSITTAMASRAMESNGSTVRPATAGLHYSDPDGLRATQRYEVVNGLNQQDPTPQKFRGPFFTESKPTTHDPTVALYVRVSEEEELANWFRDGHRPARQKEYAKSLIAAAEAADKTRRHRTGGEVYAGEKSDPYINTFAFVRLYENLSEYAEEGRNGAGQSYFTRHWAPTTSQLQGVGYDRGGGYTSKGAVHTRWPKSPGFKPPERSAWG
ncbi:hypothetical protein E8E13_004938 [Curvularia kusanoi]|uniref:Uncharacterized protein n=1 Tax=Curvularia kusanoi TaxID=90978 RepID=A0A9P4TFQ1_CURKU|nr:hypothetical protein E8E13_004938 [Curvularia kusanoi]